MAFQSVNTRTKKKPEPDSCGQQEGGFGHFCMENLFVKMPSIATKTYKNMITHRYI